MAVIGRRLLYKTLEEHREALESSSDGRLAITTSILLIICVLLLMLLCEWCERCAIRRHNAAVSAASNVGSGPAAVVFVDVGQRLRQLRELPLGIIIKDKEGGDGDGLGSGSGSGSEEREGEEDVCAICLEEFSSGEEVRELPNCSHMFHRMCIDPWLLLYSAQCPVCRGKTLDTLAS